MTATRGEREYFDSPQAALGEWQAIPTASRQQIRQLISFMENEIGPASKVYIGQGGDVVAMSFGGSEKVGLYVHPGRMDISPDEVRALGGHARLAEKFPCITRPTGQRSDYARWKFTR